MIYFELETERFVRLLNLLGFGARQPISFSIKNDVLKTEHYIKRWGGYKILILKKNFFVDIQGEGHFQLDTKKLLNEKKFWSRSLFIRFEIIPNTDTCSITTFIKKDGDKTRTQVTQGFFPIKTISERYPSPMVRFQGDIPIVKRQRLYTHIKMELKDLERFSSYVNKNNFLEFKLEKDIIKLHIKPDTGGDYYIEPDQNFPDSVVNGCNLSINFDNSFKEAIQHFQSQIIHIYTKKKGPMFFIDKKKDYALGVLLKSY